MKYIVFLVVLLMNSTFVFSSESTKVFFFENSIESASLKTSYLNWQPVFETESSSFVKPKAEKLKAILLALFLGHFGVHRIYLGTSPNVPVVYTLTLGGGFGLLPLLDIIAILTSDDLSEFKGSSKVIMWAK